MTEYRKSMINLKLEPKRSSPKLVNFLKFCMSETQPIVVILLGLAIELAHMATTIWLNFYLYSSDSLTMVIVRQSLAHKEPPLWIFSSQFNLFPEGPLYFISSILTSSVRASLVMNSIINVALFYVLLRIVAGLIYPKKRIAVQIAATLATLIFITEMLLERIPAINQNTIATLYLFNTYYYGVILAGLATLAICVSLLKRKAIGIKENFWLYAVAISISGLATFSNPLFIIQFEIPFIIVLLLLNLLRLVDYKKAMYLFIASSGTILGYFLRQPFKN